MNRIPATFYRYRAFNTVTLDSLCHDTLHFAHPGTFNDPLDCKPNVECDSSPEELRALLAVLIRGRVSAEVVESLRAARLHGDKANVHAAKQASAEAVRELQDIAYHATNPDYTIGKEAAERSMLTREIERELLRYYERGVCCFSTSYSNPLLWSHYGDQHRGVCIGYGLERTPKPRLEKVAYGGKRNVYTSTLTRAFVNDDSKAREELDQTVLLRKARGWGYEKEWRLIGTQGLQDSPLLLKEVTFGLRCTSSVMHAVVQALAGRERRVKFYGTFEVRGRYVLRRRELDIDDLADLPRTAESAEEIFGPFESSESRAEIGAQAHAK